ncbi:MAG: hypothetical protein RL490_2832 [Pseudomonadota bacterium]|jgi:GNAT superfamily N-acetyltransferase
MSEILFRAALPDELPAIIALLQDDMLGQRREADAGDPAYRAAFDAIAVDPNQMLVAAIMDGSVVCTMQLSFLPGLSGRGAWRCQIEAVRVAAALRSAGIGARMIGWAIDRARDRGCAQVQLTTDRQRLDAHRFYDRLGFSASHLGYKLAL